MENLETRIKEYREFKRLAEEAAEMAEAIADELKAAMTEAGQDKMVIGEYKLTYTAYESSRVDTTALKKELPDVAARYTKTTTARRFQVA